MPKNSSYSAEMPPPTQTVRIRVRELLDKHADVKRSEFARAIGQDPSFVTKFLDGKRDAKDILLLVRIARFFGVSVGYLIGETPRGQDALIEAIVSAAREISEVHQQIVLTVAQSFPPATPPPTDAGSSAGPRSTPRKRR